MSDLSLLVMCPTRGRPEQCRVLLKSFEDSNPGNETVLLFITDGDDDSYHDMDWGSALHAVLTPRDSLVGIYNQVAGVHVDDFDAIMNVGDDCVFETSGWDEMMFQVLADLGGSGFVYPDCKRRSDIPEVVMISSDVIRTIGHFAEPTTGHFYCDNVWAELGKRSGLIRGCPAVIRHNHYSITPGVVRDATYSEAEEMYGGPDAAAFMQWRATVMPHQVALLRREFNPDVRWVLGKI